MALRNHLTALVVPLAAISVLLLPRGGSFASASTIESVSTYYDSRSDVYKGLILEDYDPGNNLAGSNSGPITYGGLSYHAVPEPSTLALLAVGAASLLCGVWLRRR